MPSRTPELRTTVIEDFEAFKALEEEWDELFANCTRPSMGAMHAWLVAWWECFYGKEGGVGLNCRLYVLMVRDESGRAIAGIPLFEETHSSVSPRVRRLRGLGYLGNEGNYDMTEEPTILVGDGREAEVFEEVARIVRSGIDSGRWDFVLFRRLMNQDDGVLAKSFSSIGPVAALLTVKPLGGSDYAELPETWEIYRKSLSKSMRDNLGYYPRLLTRDGHNWEIKIVSDPQEVAVSAAQLADLHVARAESSRGIAHHNHIHGPAQRTFLCLVLERLAARGKAYIAELVIDGKVAASQAFVEDRDQLLVYYSGYHEEWYKYSPVFVISGAVFKSGLERGVRRLNFLVFHTAWKSRWGTVPGLMEGAFIVAKRPSSRLRFGGYTLGRAYQEAQRAGLRATVDRLIGFVKHK